MSTCQGLQRASYLCDFKYKRYDTSHDVIHKKGYRYSAFPFCRQNANNSCMLGWKHTIISKFHAFYISGTKCDQQLVQANNKGSIKVPHSPRRGSWCIKPVYVMTSSWTCHVLQRTYLCYISNPYGIHAKTQVSQINKFIDWIRTLPEGNPTLYVSRTKRAH